MSRVPKCMSFIPEALQKHLNIYVEQNSIGIINSFTNHVWSKCIYPQAYVTDRQTDRNTHKHWIHWVRQIRFTYSHLLVALKTSSKHRRVICLANLATYFHFLTTLKGWIIFKNKNIFKTKLIVANTYVWTTLFLISRTQIAHLLIAEHQSSKPQTN